MPRKNYYLKKTLKNSKQTKSIRSRKARGGGIFKNFKNLFTKKKINQEIYDEKKMNPWGMMRDTQFDDF